MNVWEPIWHEAYLCNLTSLRKWRGQCWNNNVISVHLQSAWQKYCMSVEMSINERRPLASLGQRPSKIIMILFELSKTSVFVYWNDHTVVIQSLKIFQLVRGCCFSHGQWYLMCLDPHNVLMHSVHQGVHRDLNVAWLLKWWSFANSILLYTRATLHCCVPVLLKCCPQPVVLPSSSLIWDN